MSGYEFDLVAFCDIAFKAIATLITWCLVVLGWLIVSDQTQGRELVKNYYSDLTRLRADLIKIEESAVAHHTGATYDHQKVRQIVRDIARFAVEVSQLAKRRCLGSGANEYVAAFRQAITGRNFDSSSFSTQSNTSAIILNIEVAKDALDRVLLESIDIVSYRRRTLAESLKTVLGWPWFRT